MELMRWQKYVSFGHLNYGAVECVIHIAELLHVAGARHQSGSFESWKRNTRKLQDKREHTHTNVSAPFQNIQLVTYGGDCILQQARRHTTAPVPARFVRCCPALRCTVLYCKKRKEEKKHYARTFQR